MSINRGDWFEFIGGQLDGQRLIVIGQDESGKIKVNVKSSDGRYTLAFMRLLAKDLQDPAKFKQVDGPRRSP